MKKDTYPDAQALGEYFLSTAAAQGALTAMAKDAREQVAALLPPANLPRNTGFTKRSIRWSPAAFNPTTGRYEAAVYTTSPFWHLIEFGSGSTRPYAFFRRGLVKAKGLNRFILTPKGEN